MLPPAVTDLNCQLVTLPFTGEASPPDAVSVGTAVFMTVQAMPHPGLISSAGPVSLDPIVTAPWAGPPIAATAAVVHNASTNALILIRA
jgi:hypothetical protein